MSTPSARTGCGAGRLVWLVFAVLAVTQAVVGLRAWKLNETRRERDRLAAKVQAFQGWAEWMLAAEEMEGGRLVGITGVQHRWRTALHGMPAGRYVVVVLVSGDDCTRCVRSLVESCLETLQPAVKETSGIIVVTDTLGAVVNFDVSQTIPGVQLVLVPSLASVLSCCDVPATPSVALVERRTGIIIWACPYQLGARARSRFFAKVKSLMSDRGVSRAP